MRKKKDRKAVHIPALLLLVFWPCMVHMQQMRTGLENQPWFPDIAEQADFFMQIRSIGLIILAVWMVMILVDRWVLQRKRSITLRTIWPLLLYLLLAVLSTVFSVDHIFSLSGVTEQTETIWVIFAYAVVFLYFCDTIRNYDCKDLMMMYLLVGAGIQCMIGITQMTGCDFWSSATGQRLILLGTGSTQELQFSFTSNGNNQVYMSFYNPNYAAVYIVLILPIAICAVFYMKKKWQKIMTGVVTVLLFVNLWGTRSKAGFLTVLILVLMAGIILLGTAQKRLLFLTGFVICMTVYVGIGAVLPGKSTAERIVQNVRQEKRIYPLKYVKVDQDEVRFRYKKDIYCMRLESDGEKTWFSVTDRSGKPYELVYRKKDGVFKLKGISYKKLCFAAYQSGEAYHLIIYNRDIPLEFIKKDGDSPYRYVTVFGKEDIPVKAKYAFGRGYEKGFSERVYLWSRTLPLLKKYLLTGSGPNTFSLVFPQNDYVMRSNLGMDMLAQIISRPHNIYLQCAVQTGMFSLIVLLVFMVRYFVFALRKPGQKENADVYNKNDRKIQIAFLLAAAGFLIMGLANDSLVVTTPVFCGILGCGYGLTDSVNKFR